MGGGLNSYLSTTLQHSELYNAFLCVNLHGFLNQTDVLIVACFFVKCHIHLDFDMLISHSELICKKS